MYPSTVPSPHRNWWKEAVVYQIYPRSFKDSNGDGIGDLKGIRSKLDYIGSLGIDVVWLNPVYQSPNDDNGYDISDYRNIMNDFGTMDDFDALLQGLHERGIRLVMDLVVNHSSDEHLWFQQSKSSRDNPYRDFYHWWPAEKGTPPQRWSIFDEDANAWAYDPVTDAYYLHYFSKKQPDLNWENPQLRREIYDMMDFWFKKGIDGFRMDVISVISKDPSFPPVSEADIAEKYHGSWPEFYAKGPKVHTWLQEMHREVLSKYDIMTVAEGWGVVAEDVLKYVDAERGELDMLYHFEAMEQWHLPTDGTPQDPKFDLLRFKEIHTRWDRMFAEKGWGTVYLGNHDQARMVSRWGHDDPAYRVRSSKMLTTFILTMRGTPYYLAGDELGMTSIKFDDISDYRDIYTLNTYKRLSSQSAEAAAAYLEAQKIYGRDNSRTPFQWDGSRNAGFTTGTPWIKINPDFTSVNAENAEQDPTSTLHYFRDLIRLRKAKPALIYGAYHLLDENNPQVYAYTRSLGEEVFLILLNFSSQDAQVDLGALRFDTATRVMGNYVEENTKRNLLRPCESVIYFLDLLRGVSEVGKKGPF